MIDLDAVDRHIEPFNGCPECKTREMAAELRAAREARDALVKFHDEYDSGTDRFKVRGRVFRILDVWDRAVGHPVATGGGR